MDAALLAGGAVGTAARRRVFALRNQKIAREKKVPPSE